MRSDNRGEWSHALDRAVMEVTYVMYARGGTNWGTVHGPQ